MEKKACFLRKTDIVLLDGKTYSFRALPLSQSTIGIVEAIVDDSVGDMEKLKALLQAIQRSLSFDQDQETIEYVMENGLIPMSAKGSDGNLHSQVMEALIAGLKG